MHLRAQVPNLITAANAVSGLLAILAVFQNRYEWALVFFLLGLFADFLDGWIARFLGVTSDLGVQLDSLADMVTSGVLPGLLVYQLMRSQSPLVWELASFFSEGEGGISLSQVGWVGILLPLGAAFRLARFNLDTDQKHYFKGLATPACALFFLGYPLLLQSPQLTPLKRMLSQPEVLTFWVVFFVFLMNSPLRMFKVKWLTWYDRIYLLGLILGSLLLFTFFGYGGFSLCILLYILLCLVRNVTV
ncbi:MAG: CDP-alcohol phosphatidyltransferase family protein [Flavobacteriaceae bacterium]